MIADHEFQPTKQLALSVLRAWLAPYPRHPKLTVPADIGGIAETSVKGMEGPVVPFRHRDEVAFATIASMVMQPVEVDWDG